MQLCFIAGAPIATFRSSTSTCVTQSLWRGQRLRIATTSPSRRSSVKWSVCATAKKDPNAVDDEEQLDEAAMRAAEIHEVLSGLKDFKNRIIDDATKLAKKVKAPKKQLEAALASHPDILKIDGHIKELEEELKLLGDR